MNTPARVALKRSVTSSPGLMWVSSPPPSAAGGGVEVDVVVELVGRRIDQRQLEIVALVDDHQRAGDRAVVGEGVDLRPVVVDHDLLLDDRHLEGDDFGPAARRLLVRMNERRRDERDFAARQIDGLFGHRRHSLQHGGGARGGAGGQKQIAAVEHGSLLGVRRLAALMAPTRRPERCWPSMFRLVCRALRGRPRSASFHPPPSRRRQAAAPRHRRRIVRLASRRGAEFSSWLRVVRHAPIVANATKSSSNCRTRRMMNLKSSRRPPLDPTAVVQQEIFAEARLSTCGGIKSLKLLKALSRKALTSLDET